MKLDKDDYYENEALTGKVVLNLERPFKDFLIRLSLIYEEHYVLFNEDGDTALTSKDYKKKLITYDMNCTEVFEPGEHHIVFGLRLPSRIENGTFYHAGETLSARI